MTMLSLNSLRPFVVGIAGGTGAGKTIIAQRLAERHANLGVVVVDQDSYYKDQTHLTFEQRVLTNYDQPSALDYDLMVCHMRRLAAGEPIEKPRYCFVTHTRLAAVVEIRPAPLVIFEGLMALGDERLRALMGLKIFVDADADIRLIRRLVRDVRERGRTLDSTVTQYRNSIRPMHRQFIEPTRAYADLVVDTTERALEDSLADIDRALASRWGAVSEETGLT
jgi:uridine kinase